MHYKVFVTKKKKNPHPTPVITVKAAAPRIARGGGMEAEPPPAEPPAAAACRIFADSDRGKELRPIGGPKVLFEAARRDPAARRERRAGKAPRLTST